MNLINTGIVAMKKIRKLSLLNDNSYSWWCHPISVYDQAQNINYLSTIGPIGENVISKLENEVVTSLVLHTSGEKDEHDAAAFLIKSDHILCAWTGHNTSFFYVQKIAKDLSGTLSAKTDIGTSSGLVTSSYTQLIEAGGKIFIFTRSAQYNWRVTWSTDGGTTWQSSIVLFSTTLGELFYTFNLHIAGDKIMIGCYFHPTGSGDLNKFYLYQIDATTGDITYGGVLVTNLFTGFTTIPVNSAIPVFSMTTGNGFRFLDMCTDGKSIYIFIAEFLTASIPTGDYKLIKINPLTNLASNGITLAAHGEDTFPSYFGGAYFVVDHLGKWNSEITVSREVGGTYYIEVHSFNGTGFTLKKSVEYLVSGVNGLSLTRPKPPINSKLGGLKMIYQTGDYNEVYTDWDNVLMGVKGNFINSAPAISLTVDNPLANKNYIQVGDTYIDRYAAMDDKDGDISGSVIVTGSVNSAVAGTYSLGYSVTDSNGLSNSINRSVIVRPVDVSNYSIFDGVNDTITFGTGIISSAGTELSALMKFKRTGVGSVDDTNGNFLILTAVSGSSSVTGSPLSLRLSSTGRIQYTIGQTSGSKNAAAPLTNVWYSIVMTFKNGVNKLYLDGKLIFTSAAGSTTLGGTGSQIMAIGRALSVTRAFQGQIDNFYVIPRELNNEEVYDYLNNSLDLTVNAPTAYYQFAGNATDLSGNGHTGTVNGATFGT